jgi:hypothetical protein
MREAVTEAVQWKTQAEAGQAAQKELLNNTELLGLSAGGDWTRTRC